MQLSKSFSQFKEYRQAFVVKTRALAQANLIRLAFLMVGFNWRLGRDQHWKPMLELVNKYVRTDACATIKSSSAKRIIHATTILKMAPD